MGAGAAVPSGTVPGSGRPPLGGVPQREARPCRLGATGPHPDAPVPGVVHKVVRMIEPLQHMFVDNRFEFSEPAVDASIVRDISVRDIREAG